MWYIFLYRGRMNKENRTGKTYRSMLGFLALLAVIILALSFLFAPLKQLGYQYTEVQTKVKELEKLEDHPEVLFFGDSIAWSGYDPEVFWTEDGIPSYSCATSGQWLGDGRIILETALKEQDPKVILWDANSFYTNISRIKYALSSYLPVFHYHFAWTALAVDESDPKLRGFNRNSGIQPYSGSEAYMDISMGPEAMKDIAGEELDRIEEICCRDGVRLIVVCAPNPMHWNMGRHTAVQQWCDQKNIAFIDCNLMTEELGIDWQTDTRDGGEHMNDSGAGKISRYLAGYLRENCSLEDHRNDSEYQAYNRDYGEADS